MLSLNHIHLKATDPRKTAAWYVEMFGAEIVRDTENQGAVFLGVDVAGIRLSISSPAEGQSLPQGSADVHLGLEHYGLETDDLEGLMARLQSGGVEVLEPLRALEDGRKFAFILAPDDVRIELMQLPS